MLVESSAAASPSFSSVSTLQAARCPIRLRRKEAIAGAEQSEADALSLAQLLASRMCHDLSGAIGVTASAEDLIGPGPELEADALALVADAGRRAAARLAFFRAAFGFDRTSREMRLSELRVLVEAALDRPRLHFAWGDADLHPAAMPAELPGAVVRLVLCLALLASEALPRGGTVRMTSLGNSPQRVSVEAEGPGARLTTPVLLALRATDCGDLTSASVVGYLVQLLAGRLASSVVAELGDDRVRLSVAAAGSASPRRH